MSQKTNSHEKKPTENQYLQQFLHISERHSPVLNLQQVTHEGVAGAALHEVPLSLEKLLAGDRPKLALKVVEQSELAVFLDLMEGHGIHHGLDHTAVIRRHHNVVGLDADWYMLKVPDTLE